MNPDPTITITCDYLVEFTDDGQQPDQEGPEIIIPPPAQGSDPAPHSGSLSEPEPPP
jgi:hypothetical protein